MKHTISADVPRLPTRWQKRPLHRFFCQQCREHTEWTSRKKAKRQIKQMHRSKSA